jgi:hypothetical protein
VFIRGSTTTPLTADFHFRRFPPILNPSKPGGHTMRIPPFWARGQYSGPNVKDQLEIIHTGNNKDALA